MRIRLGLLCLVFTACSFGDNGTFREGPGPTGTCGDGRVDSNEGCDDGNVIDGDGCSEDCSVETANPVCGNGVRESGEPCDDGNSVTGDGCSPTCEVESVCGNGVRETGEACDDGNTTSGDDCSATCEVETPAACTLVPQTGCDPGDACDLDNDSSTECRDVTANGTADSRCSSETACAAGFTCVGTEDAPNITWCDRFCETDNQCGAGEKCALELTSGGNPTGVKLCSNSCNISAQSGCPQGLGCLGRQNASGDFTTCQPMGTTLDGDTCAASTDCLPGSLCVSIGGVASCHSYCEIDDPICGAGETCRQFTNPLDIGGVTFGACAE